MSQNLAYYISLGLLFFQIFLTGYLLAPFLLIRRFDSTQSPAKKGKMGLFDRAFDVVGDRIYSKIVSHGPIKCEFSSVDLGVEIKPLLAILGRQQESEFKLRPGIEYLVRGKKMCPRECKAESETLVRELIVLRTFLLLIGTGRPAHFIKKLLGSRDMGDELFVDGKLLFVDKFIELLLAQGELDPAVKVNTCERSTCTNNSCEYRDKN